MKYIFEKIYLDRVAQEDPLTGKILSNFKGFDIEVVNNRKVIKDFVLKNYEDPTGGGKKILFLTHNKGSKIKDCPCSKGSVSCGYYIVNFQTGCPIDCSYCILQSYLNNPFISIYTNTNDYLNELKSFLESKKGISLRIGTGELTDSLALDDLTGLSSDLIELFRDYPNAKLELKTKSSNIENLLKIKPPQNIVVAWSLNPQKVIDSDEIGSESFENRLESAKMCEDMGYKLAFHFDPIVLFDGWEEEYKSTVEKLFDKVNHKNIEWISLGALRFDPSLKPIMMDRHLKSKLITEEFILGSDNKLRYLRKDRFEIFQFMTNLIKSYSKNLFIYLCMESKEIFTSII